MKVRDVVKHIETDGWFYVKTVGSHRHYKHSIKQGKVTVAGHPSDEVPPGTLSNIWRQAGLSKP
ncbi:MAG: type II toxin-antitoxin system HicA family toxin [Armatimonadota bacterium]|nr:type II toxin-antitoxin system HicA family toxin [Armatimonadota bacterium]